MEKLHFTTIESTNDYLKSKIDENIDHDIILIVDEQTNGKGQNDKSFWCPKDTGLYFSILHFYINLMEIEDITIKVGNIIHDILKSKYNIDTNIKLINDLYKNNKKVCGILCKNIISKKAIIIGIGIDLYKNNNIPDDLIDIVGYIFDEKIDKFELADFITEKIYEDCFMEC